MITQHIKLLLIDSTYILQTATPEHSNNLSGDTCRHCIKGFTDSKASESHMCLLIQTYKDARDDA